MRYFKWIVVLVLTAGAWVIWQHLSSPGLKPISVKTIRVSRGTLVSCVTVPGRIVSQRVEKIKAPAAGVIRHAPHLEEGSEVKEGETIGWVEKRPEELKSLQRELRLAEIDLNLARQRAAQAEELYEAKAISARQVEELKIMVTKQHVAVERLREQIQSKVLTSPFSGRVIKIKARDGQLVSAGDELYTLVDVDALGVELEVDEFDISKVKPGQQAVMTGQTFSGKLEGKVTKIATTVRSPDEHRYLPTFAVNCSIEEKERVELKVGASVQARIIIGIQKDVISLPLEAVIYRDKGPGVFLATSNVATWRDVKTGLSNDTRVEIVEGLQEGDRVIIEGNLDLSHGDRIKLGD